MNPPKAHYVPNMPNSRPQVVASAPFMHHMYDFSSEFLRPTTTADGAVQMSMLDNADHKVDNKFYGAAIAELNAVPHNNGIRYGATTTTVLPQAPVAFASAPVAFPAAFGSVLPAATSTSVTPPLGTSVGGRPGYGQPIYGASRSLGVTRTISSGPSTIGRTSLTAPQAYSTVIPTTTTMPHSTTVVPANSNYHNLTSLAGEFLTPCVAATSAYEAKALDAADGSMDNRFYGAHVVPMAGAPR